ncbi:transposase [Undibacterium sp. Jales W-56]|uniref:REP-associated tyrosine transposase n=1 Tax=Undibacterium sp. Jales W-56 TaxID=2897325 RepID=UPI0021CF676E|nr:transposase [Undibacterium sp. Jales W-56]MCU6434373.1 transposase [Undibacterium sp. Jales W-56]
MSNYRRAFLPGGTWFFTVNLLERHRNDLLVREIALLRQVVKRVRQRYPFHIDAWVVLPEHMHCVFTLPPGDSDFSLRWRLIKSGFSRALPKTESLSAVRQAAGERGMWQRHYWEHLIRDEEDYQRHVDYVHVNPLKHGLVQRVADWPYSTFHRAVAAGIYPVDWCGDESTGAPGDD